MNLETLRYIIPVNSFTEQPAKVAAPPVEKPNVGIRWGRPSDFEFSNQGKKTDKNRRTTSNDDESEGRDPEPADAMVEVREFTSSVSRGQRQKFIDPNYDGKDIAVFQPFKSITFENTRPVKYEVGRDSNDEPIFVEFSITTEYILEFKFSPEGETYNG